MPRTSSTKIKSRVTALYYGLRQVWVKKGENESDRNGEQQLMSSKSLCVCSLKKKKKKAHPVRDVAESRKQTSGSSMM